MQPANQDGVTQMQHAQPGKIDVVLGSPARKTRRPAPASGPSWGRWALLVALGLGGAWYWQGSKAPASVPAVAAEAMPAPAPEAPQPLIGERGAAKPAPAHSFAPIETAPAPFVAEPAPAPAPAAPRTGLVSQAYLDKFHATRQPAARPRAFQTAQVMIRGVREGRYQAQWRIYDGVIDNDSVCMNFEANTGEHMDCRAAAAQFFREQCKSWSRRAEGSRDEVTKATREQYCGASQSFKA
ncbi:hypothetical protein [Pseudomonas sp. NPDC007930]|uniref:hypothetical protein n=1 Tax=Pseudomonas sp. NPDC007930 TaxID=3364417 RepID=UPI0036E52D63